MIVVNLGRLFRNLARLLQIAKCPQNVPKMGTMVPIQMGPHLNGPHLNGALLNGAPLNGAPLNGAHLNGAHLNGAHLNGAHLNGAQNVPKKVKKLDSGWTVLCQLGDNGIIHI